MTMHAIVIVLDRVAEIYFRVVPVLDTLFDVSGNNIYRGCGEHFPLDFWRTKREAHGIALHIPLHDVGFVLDFVK